MGRTRKEASILLRKRRVSIDDVVTTRGADQVDPARQTVRVDGAVVTWLERRVLMMHKPAGVVTATQDDREPTVLDLVPPDLRRGLLAVGRLDKDTTGLLLLTDDGGLVHALTHPKRGIEKVYEATYEGELDDAPSRFEAGLTLADGTICRPARIELHDAGRARVTLHEGRYHQVKRMIAACGGHVTGLHRVAVGDLRLDPALAPGSVRPLTADELALLEGSAD